MNVKLSADNRLAFLTDTYDSGNYIHERTLYDDFIDLMQFANIDIDEYNVDDTLKSITVVNPLPSVPVNQALQLIANAGRCVCFQDRDGVIQMMANFSLVVDPDDMQVTTSSATDYSHPQNNLLELPRYMLILRTISLVQTAVCSYFLKAETIIAMTLVLYQAK